MQRVDVFLVGVCTFGWSSEDFSPAAKSTGKGRRVRARAAGVGVAIGDELDETPC